MASLAKGEKNLCANHVADAVSSRRGFVLSGGEFGIIVGQCIAEVHDVSQSVNARAQAQHVHFQLPDRVVSDFGYKPGAVGENNVLDRDQGIDDLQALLRCIDEFAGAIPATGKHDRIKIGPVFSVEERVFFENIGGPRRDFDRGRGKKRLDCRGVGN
ncbi:MAG: hypothetical protein F4013_00410, partial [Gammaproteobacteria bacterium]|nr:hypothetical protein [Gammaproteobacteria bacterium]